MAFYANKVDLSHYGRYQFDKIFSSRAAMDKEATLGTDGLFAGRFALVSYSPDPDAEFKAIDIILGYRNESTGIIYADIRKTQPYIYTNFTHLETGDPQLRASNYNKLYYYDGINYIHLASSSQFIEGNTNYYVANVTNTVNIVSLNSLVRIVDAEGSPTGVYYRCTGGTEGEPAVWSEILLGSLEDASYSYPDYLVNFNLDKATYGDSFDVRGYDGTVWQKVFSDGYGKFILIGRATATLPAMELYPDPPKLIPNAPYIDALSSDQFYRIHVPSMWGFQIKEAKNNELSDQNMTVTRYEINEETGESSSYQADIPVAIYFNKDGSNKAIHKNDTTIANEILLTPTGESGKKYYDKQGNLSTIDMLELTIHTPAIGNMISDGYDLIYGVNENSDIRPLDIEWKDGSASDTEKRSGNFNIGGKAHNLDTLAGTLNTMHDILGQIIVQVDVLPQPTSMDYNLIYKCDGRYYRRSDSGKVSPVEETDFVYTKVDRADLESTCPFNKYFEYQGTSIPAGIVPSAAIEFKENTSYNYFLKNLNKVRYHAITPQLIPYTPGQYFRKMGTDYIRDVSEIPLDPETRYWEINPGTGITFNYSYSANGTFFTYDNVTKIYTPSFTEAPSAGTNYYVVYAAGNAVATNVIFYRPNIFFYRNNNGDYILETSETRVLSHLPYYRVIFKDTLHYGQDSNGNAIQYREMDRAEQLNNLVDIPGDINSYYFKDNATQKWIPYTALATMDLVNGESPYTVARTYYKINVEGPYTEATLFLPYLYYELIDGNYILSSTWKGATTPYYSITASELPQVFYIPEKYWYELSANEFELAGESGIEHSIYYRKTNVYVDYDTAGQCPHGYEWNDYSAYIPPSITLYYKTEEADKEELLGIENGDCSIYGSLLELHKQLDFNNRETRKTNTFRGCFNALNDMLYRIKELRPGQILTVNEFGQVISISLTDLKTKLNALP